MKLTANVEALEPCPQAASATDKQAAILAWVRSYIAQSGFSPTIREIGKAFGIASSNGVSDHLWRLRRKGLVTWVDGRSRTLRVLEAAA
jgi:repressor LexA